MRVNPLYLPDPNATLSQAMVHRIIDDADVEVDVGDIDLSAANVIAIGPDESTAYTDLRPSLQARDQEFGLFHVSGISLTGKVLDNVFRKQMNAYWRNPSDMTDTKLLPGWPVYISRAYQTWADQTDWLGYSLAVEWALPWVQADPTLNHTRWNNNSGGSNGNHRGIMARDVFLINDLNCTTATIALTTASFIGMTEALVHYSLSSSFNPGDLYALYHSDDALGVSRIMRIPVSWNGSNISGITFPFMPLGIIREVYTASGVTTIAVPFEQTVGSPPDAQPYYVAKIFFWGCVCP